MPRSKKAKNIKKHFFNRCLERIGVHIDSKNIVKMIQKNMLKFVKRTSNIRTVFLYHCDFSNLDYKVIYDKKRHDVVTIYPFRERKETK